MLVVYPYHFEDEDAALRLSMWIRELGTVENHQALIIHDKLASPETGDQIAQNLRAVFRHVVRMPLRESAPGIRGMNLLFRRALRQVQASSAGHFLWMNPDAIPLREEWLDAIDAAWEMKPRGKHFLGCHLTGSIPHMAAVGVYSQDAEQHAPNLVMAENNPFNLNAAPQMVPKMAATTLIVDTHLEWDDAECAEAARLQPNAVLWHGSLDCKSGALIETLRGCLESGSSCIKALPIAEVVKAREERSGTFEVPKSPLVQDRMATLAASRAGSEGLPADEVDTSTHITKAAPPLVNPVKVRESVAINQASVERREEKNRAESAHDALLVTPANVGQITAALAGFREKDAASKAVVLAALREHGFPIAGKQKQGGRR